MIGFNKNFKLIFQFKLIFDIINIESGVRWKKMDLRTNWLLREVRRGSNGHHLGVIGLILGARYQSMLKKLITLVRVMYLEFRIVIKVHKYKIRTRYKCKSHKKQQNNWSYKNQWKTILISCLPIKKFSKIKKKYKVQFNNIKL